jgi:hypothetical protein
MPAGAETPHHTAHSASPNQVLLRKRAPSVLEVFWCHEDRKPIWPRQPLQLLAPVAVDWRHGAMYCSGCAAADGLRCKIAMQRPSIVAA